MTSGEIFFYPCRHRKRFAKPSCEYCELVESGERPGVRLALSCGRRLRCCGCHHCTQRSPLRVPPGILQPYASRLEHRQLPLQLLGVQHLSQARSHLLQQSGAQKLIPRNLHLQLCHCISHDHQSLYLDRQQPPNHVLVSLRWNLEARLASCSSSSSCVAASLSFDQTTRSVLTCILQNG